MHIVLLSTYEMGRQPFGLASPAAWLRNAGHRVHCFDLAVQKLPAIILQEADVIGFYVPMHTATRLAVAYLDKIKSINPKAHICFYGLYAPVNAAYLQRQGVQTVLGGEFETGLVQICDQIQQQQQKRTRKQSIPRISLERQQFLVPDRRDLPELSHYAHLFCNDCSPKKTGYVEASRGCKHQCRHCPIVPVYNGRFRIVQRGIVLADIRQQVEAGAQHITFGDPDFFNGIGHALPIVEEMHREFPELTYDVTIKVEHLLKYAEQLPVLKETGCVLVTSAVESFDDHILKILDKGHTRADFIRVLEILQQTGLPLNPTFVAFTPWITLEGYQEFLTNLLELNLVQNISPVQLAIRLLLPSGSRLFDHLEMMPHVDTFDQAKLTYIWHHSHPVMDELQEELMKRISDAQAKRKNRWQIFREVWQTTASYSPRPFPFPPDAKISNRTEIPYLNEPWYC